MLRRRSFTIDSEPGLIMRIVRHELKYIVDRETAGAVRRWIGAQARRDEHARACDDFKYRVSSVYLDSADLRLARETMEGESDRVKLRIRRYLDRASGDYDRDRIHATPVFVEIKRNTNGVIRKRRAQVPTSVGAALLDPGPWRPGISGPVCEPSAAVMLEFDRLRRRYRAGPTAIVQYDREPFIGAHDEHVRITFDDDLRVSLPNGTIAAASGAAELHAVELSGVILEIKFTNSIPRWTADLIRRFDLNRRSVPKYVLALSRMRDPAVVASLAAHRGVTGS